MLYHGSFYRLFTSYGVQEETSAETKSNQNGSQSKFYDTSDTEAPEASTFDMNSTKNKVMNGFDYTDVGKTEFATTWPPLNISTDKIIDVPRRGCPNGQKLDPNGKCKTVWKT